MALWHGCAQIACNITSASRGGFFMEKKLLHVAITVYNREGAYQEVNEILHRHAASILLRVGYPMRERNLAIIFLGPR